MNKLAKFLSCALVGAYALLLFVGGCASRDQANALPAPVDIALLTPPEWCVQPASLESLDTCRAYARCCDQTLVGPPETCSFARAGAKAECVCALRPGHEVLCKEGEQGITCQCK